MFTRDGDAARSLANEIHVGVRSYTQLKTITARWPTGIRSGPDFVMPAMQ